MLVVEPVHPFERGLFNVFKGPPWSLPMDDRGLVEAVDRLSQSVVVAVATVAAAVREVFNAMAEAYGLPPLTIEQFRIAAGQ